MVQRYALMNGTSQCKTHRHSFRVKSEIIFALEFENYQLLLLLLTFEIIILLTALSTNDINGMQVC